MGEGFNIKKLVNEPFKAREQEIIVPALKWIFEGDGEPVWRIRGLDGDEIGFANHMASEESQTRIRALVEAFSSTIGVKAALETFLGFGGSGGPVVTEDNIRRTYLLMHGSIEPKIDHTAAVKIRKYCYPVFRKLTDQIALLSGQGFQPGKSKPSGAE